MRIGVLALQGDVSEHVSALESAARSLGMDGQVVLVRRAPELGTVSGLLIPGGESTTIVKQVDRFGLREPILAMARAGSPIMGTCAGAILLASEIMNQKGPVPVKPLGLLDMTVRRNAFGRQVDSFERPLAIKGLDFEFPGVFIRAPRIDRIGSGLESLAMLDGEHVMVKNGNVMALTFHPELASDDRVHGLFLKLFSP